MRSLVFSASTDGNASSSALEALTKARGWGDVDVFHVGPLGADGTAALGAHGAGRIHHLDPGDALPAAPAAQALAGLLDDIGADVVLFGMGYTDRDVAGRLSARTGRPVLANATDVTVGGDGVVVSSEILGGTTKVVTMNEGAAPALVIVRPKSFAAEPSGGGSAEVVAVAMPDADVAVATVRERHVEASSGPDLSAAAVVVSGGRGMGGPEHLGMVEELAGLLGGAVGATRAVVDAGWIPYSHQVGQTGKTVKPDVYIACGISGAMQHLVGMKDSSTIIAINKDADAPIFNVADLGIVGDVHKVLPALIEELKKRS